MSQELISDVSTHWHIGRIWSLPGCPGSGSAGRSCLAPWRSSRTSCAGWTPGSCCPSCPRPSPASPGPSAGSWCACPAPGGSPPRGPWGLTPSDSSCVAPPALFQITIKFTVLLSLVVAPGAPGVSLITVLLSLLAHILHCLLKLDFVVIAADFSAQLFSRLSSEAAAALLLSPTAHARCRVLFRDVIALSTICGCSSRTMIRGSGE